MDGDVIRYKVDRFRLRVISVFELFEIFNGVWNGICLIGEISVFM